MGIAERFDIVIDFSRYTIGQTVDLVNLQEHRDGKGPGQILTVSGRAVRFIQRSSRGRVPALPGGAESRRVPDQSICPNTRITLIPNPDLSAIPVTRTRSLISMIAPAKTKTILSRRTPAAVIGGSRLKTLVAAEYQPGEAQRSRPTLAGSLRHRSSAPARVWILQGRLRTGTTRSTSTLKKARSSPATAASATFRRRREAARMFTG